MTNQTLAPGKNDTQFKSLGNNLAAHLYIPEGFDENGSCPAIIYSGPFNQVKEQTGAVYGPRPLSGANHRFDHIGYGDAKGRFGTTRTPS